MARLESASVIVLSLFIAACGGDDGESGTTSTPSTTAATSTSSAETGSSSGPSTGSTTAVGSESSTSGSTDASTTDAPTTDASTGPTTGGSSGSTDGASTSTGGTAGDQLTWENFGETFFESYCWECHGAGDAQGRDYSTLAGVVAELDSIRCGTAPISAMLGDCAGEPPAEQFPVGATLPTEMERTMLVEWLEAGAPEN